MNILNNQNQNLNNQNQNNQNQSLTFLEYMSRPKIFWDVDDVVLNSLETAIDIIKQKDKTVKQDKTANDVKDWDFKSITRKLDKSEIITFYSSEDFWSNIQIKPEFLKIIKNKNVKKCANIFVTKGDPINLEKKKKFLYEHLKDILPYVLVIGLKPHTSKNQVDMTGAIQIDDNVKYLADTNAKFKVLIKNGKDTNYNNGLGRPEIVENLYIAEDWFQAKDIIDWLITEL